MRLQNLRIVAVLTATLFVASQGWSSESIASDTVVHVTASGELDATDEESWIDISIGQDSWAGKQVNDEGTDDLDLGTAALKPGKDYTVTVTGMDVSGYRAHFNPSEGYTVFINGLERNLFDASSTELDDTSNDVFSIRVETVPGSVFTPAGEALPLSSGKVVWRVGMGQLRNGKSAGFMAIRQDALDTTTFQISSLIYDSSSPEIDRVPSSGTIEQVRAPFGLVDVSSITGGYELEFFTTATGPDGNGHYTPSGSAFVTYEITSQSSGTILRIDRIRGTQTSRTELKKYSSTEWRMTDWYQVSPSSLSSVRSDVRRLSSGNLVEEKLIKAAVSDQDSAAVTRTQDTYANKNWGKELVTSKAGYNGSSGLTVSVLFRHLCTSPRG